MTKIGYLTPALAVAGVLSTDDFAALAAQGFKSIISNRPDGEEEGQLTAREEAALARSAGLEFFHVPAAKHQVLEDQVVDALEDSLLAARGPILLHCKSGLRSVIAWAAVAARAGSPVAEIMAAAQSAGFNLQPVRDEIAARADEARTYAATKSSAACQAAA